VNIIYQSKLWYNLELLYILSIQLR